jgi:hypothetical protein
MCLVRSGRTANIGRVTHVTSNGPDTANRSPNFAAFGFPFSGMVQRTDNRPCQWPPLSMARPSPASAAGVSGVGAQPGPTPETRGSDQVAGARSGPIPSSSDNLDLPAGTARVVAEVAPGAASADWGTGRDSSGSLRRRRVMPAEPGSSPGAGRFPGLGLKPRQKLAKSMSAAPLGLRARERGWWIAYG